MSISKKEFQNVLTPVSPVSDTLDTALFYKSSDGAGFAVAIAGTFVATLRLKASFDEGTNWIEMGVFEAPDIFLVPHQPRAYWKLDGSGAGDFTSGSAIVEFAKGGNGAASVIRLATADRHLVDNSNPLAVVVVGDGSLALPIKTQVTMTGASAELVPADPDRVLVRVASWATNDPAVVDPSGGVASEDGGIAIMGGGFIEISGREAQNFMTQFGTNGQKLTVYEAFNDDPS